LGVGRTTLRVAVLVESRFVPRWISELVVELEAAPFLEAAVLEIRSDAGRPRPSLFRAYERLDHLLFGSAPDALAQTSIPFVTQVIDSGTSPEQISRVTEFLRSYAADVALNLSPVPTRPLATATRFGAWRLIARAPEREHRGPIAFDEMRTHEHVVGSALVAVIGAEDTRDLVLHRWYTAVDAVSLQRTRNQLLWKTVLFVPRALHALYAHGLQHLEASAETIDHEDECTATEPPWYTVTTHVARTAGGVIRRRLRRALYRDEWFIAIRKRSEDDIDRRISGEAASPVFQPLPSSADAYFADPFLFDHADDCYLFFERYSYRDQRGSIWCCRLDAEGAPGSLVPVLDIGSHISYPCVFTVGEQVFMVPESEEAGVVALYEAVEFPMVWRHAGTLLEDVLAVDPTIIRREGKFWLFVNVRSEGDSDYDELHLYFAEALTGPWESHPWNPLVSDVRRARNAGRIFELNGALIRPAQDCARTYGHAVTFNRIDVLTPDRYAETAIGRMNPDWLPRLSATHTYGFDKRFEVVDGNRPRRRIWNHARPKS
jgi:hypothetical protein